MAALQCIKGVYSVKLKWHCYYKNPKHTLQILILQNVDIIENTHLSLCTGLLPRRQIAVEALQVCCLLLPPASRRKLQLLMRLMTKACVNHQLPLLNDTIGTRTLVIFFYPFLIFSNMSQDVYFTYRYNCNV